MFWTGIAVSLLFVAYAVANMDLRKAASVMLKVEPLWLLPIFVVNLIVFYFRALRWWYILEPTKRVTVLSLFSGHFIGGFANMILPMRIGELVRAYYIAKKARITTSSAIATIVVERGFDVLALLILTLLVMMFADPRSIPPDTWQDIKAGGSVMVVILLAAFTVMYFIAGEKSRISAGLSRLIRKLPDHAADRAAGMYESFRGGLGVLKKGGHLFAIMAFNATAWLFMIAFHFLFLPMFGLEYSLEMAAVLTLFIIFGVSVPSSPGYIGPFHAGVVLALGFYGVDADSALGMAVIIHLTSFVYVSMAGLFFLWREKLSFSEMRHSAD
jgi:hypothetical protein